MKVSEEAEAYASTKTDERQCDGSQSQIWDEIRWGYLAGHASALKWVAFAEAKPPEKAMILILKDADFNPMNYMKFGCYENGKLIYAQTYKEDVEGNFSHWFLLPIPLPPQESEAKK